MGMLNRTLSDSHLSLHSETPCFYVELGRNGSNRSSLCAYTLRCLSLKLERSSGHIIRVGTMYIYNIIYLTCGHNDSTMIIRVCNVNCSTQVSKTDGNLLGFMWSHSYYAMDDTCMFIVIHVRLTPDTKVRAEAPCRTQEDVATY